MISYPTFPLKSDAEINDIVVVSNQIVDFLKFGFDFSAC
jgi:hypothetical protein